jgi:superfamily II DNA or RNA helicase
MNPGAPMKGVLSGWLYLPVAMLGDEQLIALQRTLTFRARKLSADHRPPTIPLYDTSVPGWFGVPRGWGREHFATIPMIDRMCDGEALASVTKRPDPNHPRAAPGQAQFMADMRQAFETYDEIQAIAPTGTGKTVTALDTAAWYGRKTLVMVHLERIADQWIEEIQDKLGVPRERIGRVQGPLCQFRDVDFAVGILNSIAQRPYVPAFYKAFGLVIIDEAHKLGTEFFSPAVPRFPARKRLTLTATEERPDGGHVVIGAHAGPVRVKSTAEALRGEVFVLDYDCGPNYRLWGTDSKARVACLSRDTRRNRIIAHQVYRAYQRGRNMLIISFAVSHLETLIELCASLGVPREAMGQYTGEWTARDANGRPLLHKGKPVRRKTSRAQFERIKANSQLIFATYNIFTEAIDIPRLDSGLDATPRSSATQVIGRIRRPLPGKKTPLWVTLRDVRCPISMRMFDSRCRDYSATGMEIINGQEARSA